MKTEPQDLLRSPRLAEQHEGQSSSMKPRMGVLRELLGEGIEGGPPTLGT